jgi:hypothetical protein
LTDRRMKLYNLFCSTHALSHNATEKPTRGWSLHANDHGILVLLCTKIRDFTFYANIFFYQDVAVTELATK